MVKIALAGGSGSFGREILNVLVATKKHEIIILSRKDATEEIPGVTWAKVNYESKEDLTKALSGVETVLSFLVAHLDPGCVSQKALVEGCIAAGVKRFAPNEWSGSSFDELPWYAGKGEMRAYLEEVNKEEKRIEYTLFQPGFLLDMIVPKGSSTKYIRPMEVWVDFPTRRAILLEGHDGLVSGTTMRDLANVVARAVEHKGEWPLVSGMKGGDLTIPQLVEIGKKARGNKPWDITYVKEADVRDGTYQPAWMPKNELGMPPDQAAAFDKVILTGSLLSTISGSWTSSDTWNKLMPDYKFEDPEEFLVREWAGRP